VFPRDTGTADIIRFNDVCFRNASRINVRIVTVDFYSLVTIAKHYIMNILTFHIQLDSYNHNVANI